MQATFGDRKTRPKSLRLKKKKGGVELWEVWIKWIYTSEYSLPAPI